MIAGADRAGCPGRRWTAFVGLGVLVLATPLTGVFVQKMTHLQEQMLVCTDKRIILVNQLLAGIKALKTYAWEAAQEARARGPGCAPPARPLACVHVRVHAPPAVAAAPRQC